MDTTIVLRCAGERTEELSRRLLVSESDPSCVVPIHEKPFAHAVRRTLEIGHAEGRPWTLAADADVLVREGSVGALVAVAERMPEDVFRVEGLVFDKLFHGYRPAGFHLYRTSLLGEALRHLSETPVHRPEHHVARSMEARGFGNRYVDVRVGIHDYEQYLRDLYRKGFVHAQKHTRYLRFLEPLWNRLAREDIDFRLVLCGMEDGLRHGGVAVTDTRFFERISADAVEKIAGQEREPLRADGLETSDVSERMAGLREAPEYRRWKKRRARKRKRKNRPPHLKDRVAASIAAPVRSVFRWLAPRPGARDTTKR